MYFFESCLSIQMHTVKMGTNMNQNKPALFMDQNVMFCCSFFEFVYIWHWVTSV